MFTPLLTLQHLSPPCIRLFNLTALHTVTITNVRAAGTCDRNHRVVRSRDRSIGCTRALALEQGDLLMLSLDYSRVPVHIATYNSRVSRRFSCLSLLVMIRICCAGSARMNILE